MFTLITLGMVVAQTSANQFPNNQDPFAEEYAAQPQRVATSTVREGAGVPSLRGAGDGRFYGEFSFRASRADVAGGREDALEQGYGWILGGKLGGAVDWAYLGDFSRGDFGRSDLRDPEETQLIAHLISLNTHFSRSDRLSLSGQVQSGNSFGQPFYSNYRPDIANPPWRSWDANAYNVQWDHALGLTHWLHCRMSGGTRSGIEGARDGADMAAKRPGDYGLHDFLGYRSLNEQTYALAVGVDARHLFGRNHGLEFWLQAKAKDAEGTHALLSGGGTWPDGQHDVWTADVQSREYLFDLRHRCQISHRLHVESVLDVAAYNYIDPEFLLLPRITLTYSPWTNTSFLSAFYQEAATPPYIYASEKPVNEYTARNQPWADNSLLMPELSQRIEIGVLRNFGGTYQARLTTYYKRMQDIILSYDLWYNRDSDPWTSRRVYWNAGQGTEHGISATLRKQMSHDVSALAEYHWRQATGQFFQGPSWRNELPYSFPETVYLDDDVRHSVKLIIDYDTARLGGVGANLSWNYHSGYPFTPVRRHSYDPSTGQPPVQSLAELNSSRCPDWSELNLLMTKNISYLPWLDVQLRVQVLNILNHINITDMNELSGDSEPMPFGGNTGTPRKLIAGFLFKF